MKKWIIISVVLLVFFGIPAIFGGYLYLQKSAFSTGNPGASWKLVVKLLFQKGYDPGDHKTFLAFKPSKEHTKVILKVPKKSVRGIGQFLEKQRLITSSEKFTYMVRLKGVDQKIKTGEFAFYTDMTPEAVLKVLLDGKIVQYKVTFPENITYLEFADILEKNQITDKKEFIRLCESSETLKKYEIMTQKRKNYQPTLEGYLYPETYLFRRNTPAKKVVERLVKKTLSQLKRIENLRKKYKWSRHQLITFASLLGKETGAKGERFKVSSVFHNRLNQNIKLQTDPTVIYMVTDRKSTTHHAAITKKHLLDKSNPYNTYIYKGLPPGPIGNPNFLSMEASVKPAKTSYIFFVSNNDGTHTFTTNYKDHEAAVKRYWQKVRAAQRGK